MPSPAVEFIDTARRQFELGNYEVALDAYKACIAECNARIRSAPNNDMRNAYVELRKTAQQEHDDIYRELVVPLRELEDLVVNAPRSDSPPTDPGVWSPPPPRPERAAVRTQNSARAQPTGQAAKNKTVSTARRAEAGKPASGSAMKGSTSQKNIKGISYGNVAGPPPSGSGSSTTASKSSTTTAGSEDGGSGSQQQQQQPEQPKFETNLYDQELVACIERDLLVRSPSVRWADISGLLEAKRLLTEAIVAPFYHPDYFKGIRRPWRGILLFGPPGTGKTMLAKAVASECQTTFFNVSSSTLSSKWRGDSEKLVRLLFEMARFYAPSTIFFDEIDSVCSQRGSSNEHEASRRVKSQILTEMDGCAADGEKTVLVLAATNHPWDLDDALRRRLEKRIYIPLPGREARLDLLQSCLQEVKLADDVALERLAERLEGYSGCDVAGICRDAAMAPARDFFHSNFADLARLRALTTAELDLPVRVEHLDAAIANIKASVSAADLERYDAWKRQFGAN